MVGDHSAACRTCASRKILAFDGDSRVEWFECKHKVRRRGTDRVLLQRIKHGKLTR